MASRSIAAQVLVDACEAERLPIAEQVSHFAMDTALEVPGQRGAVPADIAPTSAARPLTHRVCPQKAREPMLIGS